LEVSPSVQSGMDLLNKVLRLCPGMVCAYIELARCYVAQGMYDEGSRTLLQCLALEVRGFVDIEYCFCCIGFISFSPFSPLFSLFLHPLPNRLTSSTLPLPPSSTLFPSPSSQPHCSAALVALAKVELARSNTTAADRALEQALSCDFSIRGFTLFRLVQATVRAQQVRREERWCIVCCACCVLHVCC
jgi:hypothetical protein